MRRHEQERNQTRTRGYGYANQEDQSFDRDYARNDRPDADWNRTEDHFNTGHRYQDEDRNGFHETAKPRMNHGSHWNRSGMHANDYSRPRGGADLFRNNDYDTRQSDERNMQNARSAFGNSDASANWVGNERNGHFGKGPKGYRRSDERIKEDVSEALFRDQNIDATELEVEVKEGFVTLKGTIESRQAKRAAEYCVEHLSGVQDVRNEITVKKSDAPSSGNSFGQGNSQFKNQKLA
jgi:osmotically-inducible protein OsmY